tara:strand:+ start:46 stop:498 length:453 start_codon:yes stop_codon:yes gene_type:complete
MYNYDEIVKKIELYCAKQDRCKFDVNQKLIKWGIDNISIKNIINNLIEDKFIDEIRYAKSFARGKFRIKKWGKIKISNMLRSKNISENNITTGLSQIDIEEYTETLLKIIEKKSKLLKENNPRIKKNKLFQYLKQKGFENNLIWDNINNN